MNWTQSLLIVAYALLFMASTGALLWWHRHQRKRRLPFGEELRLLRTPGETQLRLVRQLDEEGLPLMALAASVPAAVALLGILVTGRLPSELQVGGAALTLVVFFGVFYFSARWFAGRVRESSNRYLGYFGERIVAEHLEGLKAQGWRILHDVPGSADGRSFNVDHIAVGPAGVFVIETKTRRKGGARPGFDSQKVYFDGRSLVWPWGEDNHGLDQAERNAVWLADTLKEELGERIYVTPYLTLPGWWVENKPSRDSRLCHVVNAKALAGFLAHGPAVLDARLIDVIATKLEARCRDVEY
jgi:Nuclease-related domain